MKEKERPEEVTNERPIDFIRRMNLGVFIPTVKS